MTVEYRDGSCRYVLDVPDLFSGLSAPRANKLFASMWKNLDTVVFRDGTAEATGEAAMDLLQAELEFAAKPANLLIIHPNFDYKQDSEKVVIERSFRVSKTAWNRQKAEHIKRAGKGWC